MELAIVCAANDDLELINILASMGQIQSKLDKIDLAESYFK